MKKRNRQILDTDQKALEINLDETLYGSFSEVGAGQEVARYFFKVGAAAGTIAKTMSAYDKVVSDDIYSPEPSGRYVCESRLYKMLDHEYDLMTRRLRQSRPETNFFVFADTVSVINYQRTIKGNGWLGLRFQLHPHKEPNEIVLHVRMLDHDNQLQQQAIGILGVNLIYACYNYNEYPETILTSLLDGLHDRIALDMVRLIGPDFEYLDNRLLSLWLVKHRLSDVAMFGPDGRSVHASEFLYKKNVMVVRGSFRPATHVNMDMINAGYEQFRNQTRVDATQSFLLTEITMSNLRAEKRLDEQDFLHRAEVLCAMGQTVVVSVSENYKHLIDYLNEYRVQNLGIVIGVRELLELINGLFYNNMDGQLLAAFGEIFTRNVNLYVYPAYQEGSSELMNCANLPVPEGVKFLFKHLIDNRQIRDIDGFNSEVLHIFSKEVLNKIQQGQPGWENDVPKKIAKLIKDKLLFGYPAEKIEFEY